MNFLKVALVLFSTWVLKTSEGVPYVTVKQGRLFGETLEFNEDNLSTQVDIFKGIPYAEPPVRFSPPTEKLPWTGDWNATRFRFSCTQVEVDPWRPWELKEGDEDCLYLNVFAPHPKPDNAAVMVYIHGGSYNTGTAMDNDLSGVPMAAIEGVIIVVINYRLNVFGYFSTGDNAAAGNFGFLDQAEALQWVRTNINAFGGDNNRVTIFGESAGSSSVDMHRYSKYSRDLFDQSILQSGTGVAWWGSLDTREEQRENAFLLGEEVGCESEDTTSLVQCLRQVDADELKQAYLSLNYNWKPNIDGVFLEESPWEMLSRGDFKDGPMIVGYNRDEGTMFIPNFYPSYIGKEDPPYIDDDTFDFMTSVAVLLEVENANSVIEDAAKQEYVDWSLVDNSTADYFSTVLPIFGDVTFSCPANDVTRAHAYFKQSQVFQYYMTHIPTTSYYERLGYNGTGWFLSGHVEDIPFVFGWPFNPDLKDLHPVTAEEREMSRNVMKLWANFAKTGDPSKASLGDQPAMDGIMEWPSFTIPELQYKELTPEFPVRRGLKVDECAFWGDFVKTLSIMIASIDEAEFRWKEKFSSWTKELETWREEFYHNYEGANTCV